LLTGEEGQQVTPNYPRPSRPYDFLGGLDFTPSHPYDLLRGGSHTAAHCHTVLCTQPQSAAHCRSAAHYRTAVTHCRATTNCRTARQMHTATRTLPDSPTLPRVLPHTATCITAHCHAHCRTPWRTLPHLAALPQTTALPRTGARTAGQPHTAYTHALPDSCTMLRALPHPATCTAKPRRAHCRTLPHCCTLPHFRTLMMMSISPFGHKAVGALFRRCEMYSHCCTSRQPHTATNCCTHRAHCMNFSGAHRTLHAANRTAVTHHNYHEL
jgi:hypothetical protein